MDGLPRHVQQLGGEERSRVRSLRKDWCYALGWVILLVCHCTALSVVLYDIYHNTTEVTKILQPLDTEIVLRLNATGNGSYIRTNLTSFLSV